MKTLVAAIVCPADSNAFPRVPAKGISRHSAFATRLKSRIPCPLGNFPGTSFGDFARSHAFAGEVPSIAMTLKCEGSSLAVQGSPGGLRQIGSLIQVVPS